jgi:3-methyladenine DNA glycosylase AlkD
MQKIKEKIIANIRQELRENIDNDYRKQSFRFFKEEVKIVGVKIPIVRKIAKKYFEQIKNLKKKEIFNLCEELLKSGKNEEITIAFTWVFQLQKQYQKSDFFIFEKWLKKYVSNWACCDDFCTHVPWMFYLSISRIPLCNRKMGKM